MTANHWLKNILKLYKPAYNCFKWAQEKLSGKSKHPTIENQFHGIVHLGGEGGKAPGAGGGGGGAIGHGARAGKGGTGGSHRIHESKYTVQREDSLSAQDIHGDLLFGPNPPGAGAGGGGAIGDGSSAGDGSDGGEHVLAQFNAEALSKDGCTHANIVIGKGGAAPRFPGQHGLKGEDTYIEFCKDDGTVLERVLAKSGNPGKSGGAYLPHGTLELSQTDLEGGFRVTTLMPANAVEQRDGLLYILGGGWIKYFVVELPYITTWAIVCKFRWNKLEGAKSKGLFVSIIKPNGDMFSTHPVIIPAEVFEFSEYNWQSSLPVELDREGSWIFRLHTTDIVLAEYDIFVQTQKH